MTTHEVANRLVAICRTGQLEAAQNELYSDDVTSTEPETAPQNFVKGIEAIKEKGRMFQSMVEEFHSSTISEPIVAGNVFAITWVMDVTMKGRGRSTMEEVCVYTVKDGKITAEEFFF